MVAEQQGNIYINGWKSIDEAFVYVGGWKRINQAYVYHNGAWRRFYAYDAIAPTVSSFTLSTLTANATYGPSTTSVTYSLIFSEQVTGLTAADFTYTGTSTTWTISAPTNPSNDKKTYVITATSTGAPATATVQIRLNANTVNDIVDGNAFNLMTDGPFLSPTINIDNTKPSVSSFASGSAASSTSVAFTLTFSESIKDLSSTNPLSTSDFTISGTSTGWSFPATGAITGSGNSYTINLSGASATAGTLILTLNANTIEDLYGNAGPAANSAATTFTVERQPPQTSVTAFTSSAPTLHNRTLSTTVSVPAGLTAVDTLYVYYYDSNDNYIDASVQTYTPSPATAGAFSYTFTKDMGRNPGTKYYVRAQTKSTQNLYSVASARQEVTTQADQTPPIASSLSLNDNGSYADPGYPGRASNSRQLTLTWSNTNLTTEVDKITVYIGSDSYDISRPAGGWGTATSRTLTGLTWGTSYSAYIRSTDIYGGTNSTADTASVSQTTTAAGYTARFDSSISVTNNYYYAGWGADSAYTDWGSVCGTPGYANDGNTGTVWVSNTSTSGRAGWTGWFSISTVEPPGGAFLDGAYITSVRVRTAKQHNNVYLGIYTAYSGAWSDNTSDGLGNDPYYGTSVISVMNSQGSGLESTFSLPFEIKIRDSANSGAGGTLGYAGHFRLRLTGDAKSYQGDYCVPASGSGTATVRFGLLEVDFTVVVRRYTPAYNY